MKNLGERLRNLRTESGKSQKEMADLLSVNRVAYTQYENDKRTPPPDTIIRLCEIFQVSADYLLGIDTPTASPTATDQHAPSLTPDEQALLSSYRQLNTNDKQDVQDYIEYRRSKSPVKDDKAI